MQNQKQDFFEIEGIDVASEEQSNAIVEEAKNTQSVSASKLDDSDDEDYD